MLKKKINLTNIDTYYFYRNKFEKSPVNKLSHKQRLLLHPILYKIISSRNRKAGFTIELLYDNRIKTTTPKIFAITHIGKFDIEIATEIVKEHYYLLSGDYENMKGTVEEIFLSLNGVIYIREDDKKDRALSKTKMIETLKKGGNMMYFPEGTWNLTENLPILQCPYGIIDVAMQAKATIIPVGIEQYENHFILAVGENFDVTKYNENDKINAINDLRSVLATLKWDIWESLNKSISENINSKTFNTHVLERLQEWPNMSYEQFLDSAYKPKNISTYSDVFAHLKSLKPNKENAFLFNKRLL